MKRHPTRHLLASLSLIFPLWVSFSSTVQSRPLKLAESAVVAMTQMPLSLYRDFGVDFVAWGGRPDTDQQTVDAFRVKIANMQKLGVDIGSVMPTRNAWRGVIRSVPEKIRDLGICRTCDMRPVLVPGLLNQTEAGNQPFWFSPTSEAFNISEMETLGPALSAGVKSVVIDDVIGALAAHYWFGGCYSRKDLEGIRATFQKLSKHSMNPDLCTFHQNAIQPGTAEFVATRTYFLQSVDRHLDQVRRLAASVGADVSISGNQQIYSSFAAGLLKSFDFFTFECPQSLGGPETSDITNIISAKIGETVGKPVILMGTGKNHRFVAENHAMILARAWIAQAYGFGAHFVVPYGVWMDREVSGSTWLKPQPGEFVPLFRFIKTHRKLFDNRSEVAKVALLLDYRALEKEAPADQNLKMTSVYRVSLELLSRGIPFKILPVKDDAELSSAINASVGEIDFVVDPTSAADRVEMAPDRPKIIKSAEEIPSGYSVGLEGGNGSAITSLRRDAHQGVTLHILNNQFDERLRHVQSRGPVTVSIPRRYIPSTLGKLRVFYINDNGQPEEEAFPHGVQQTAESIVLQLNNLPMWTIVSFD